MTETDLFDRLAKHRTFGSAPRAELEWLVAHGSLQHLETGELLSPKDAPVEGLFVLLDGRIAIFADRGGGPRKMMEWREGDVLGLLPYSRMVNPPGDIFAQEPSTILVVHRDHLRELARECYELTASFVHTMLDRARTFTTSDLHDEKLISLGKLSAGLAHELNNPASAIERSAVLLEERIEDSEQATLALGAASLPPEQLAAVDAIRNSCATTRVQGVRSPVEQAEHEDAIADWLEDHGLDPDVAETLAETAVTFDDLDRLASVIDGPALSAALHWAAAGCVVRGLASEIEEAALRISGLVLAIKGFTHMDQAGAAGPVDLLQSLNNTVAVLRAKARAKSIAIAIDVDPDVPRVHGFVGEINQIWGNLIDNALDVLPDSGRVEIKANRENGRVVVHIVDNGPGIPAEIRDRIFDPFFTTKAVGDGTGLGLDIVRRLVVHNSGDITVESEPGRTTFRVVLPAAAENEESDNEREGAGS